MEFFLKPDFLWLLGFALHSRDVPCGAFQPPLGAGDSLEVQIPTLSMPATGSSPRLAQISNCITHAKSHLQLHFAGGQSCVPVLATLGLMSYPESITDHSQNQDLHAYRYTLLNFHTVTLYNATPLFVCLLLSQGLVWGIFLSSSPIPEMWEEEMVQILQLTDTSVILFNPTTGLAMWRSTPHLSKTTGSPVLSGAMSFFKNRGCCYQCSCKFFVVQDCVSLFWTRQIYSFIPPSNGEEISWGCDSK